MYLMQVIELNYWPSQKIFLYEDLLCGKELMPQINIFFINLLILPYSLLRIYKKRKLQVEYCLHAVYLFLYSNSQNDDANGTSKRLTENTHTYELHI